ncbi:DUF1353 domain-containing protein [Acidovorax sp. LjRoot118]|uniref:DUF1353 domain-containing protein n=1 Tax=Acidovorax sp. LjRoot118 TaxID=3342256 RepID=UPI003ECFB2E4
MIPWPFPVRVSWLVKPSLEPLGNGKRRHTKHAAAMVEDVNGEDAPVIVPFEPGDETDGPSVPKLPVIHLYFADKGELPAIIHDKLYTMGWPRDWCDAVFHAALVDEVSDVDAYLMWAAVRVGGGAYYRKDGETSVHPETSREAP